MGYRQSSYKESEAMSDFESNIRSIERAARLLPDGFTGWARLVEDGVQVHIVDNRNPLDPTQDKAIDRIVPWHDLAMWRNPLGNRILRQMLVRLNMTTTMRKP